MKLDKRQFCIAVNTFRDMLTEQTMILDALDVGPEWKPGEWISNYYDLLADVCDLDVDDNYGTDLDWFCFETDFGKRKDYCKVYDKHADKTWTIDSPEILYDFITRND